MQQFVCICDVRPLGDVGCAICTRRDFFLEFLVWFLFVVFLSQFNFVLAGTGNIVMLDGVDLPARDESVGEHTQYTHIVLIWTARTTYSLSSTDVAFGTRETKQLSINGRTH